MGTVTCIQCRKPVAITPTGLVCGCGNSFAADKTPGGLLPHPPKEAA